MKAPKLNARTVAAVLGLGLLGGMVALAMRPRPAEVEIGAARTGALEVFIEEDGLATVRDRYTISSPVSGTLARLERHAGDRVEAGAVLARVLPLASPPLDARTKAQGQAQISAARSAESASREAVAGAELALARAGQELKRVAALAEGGAATPAELERATFEEQARSNALRSARFAAAVANNELAMARAAISSGGAASADEVRILAPAAGVLLQVFRESEGALQAGTPILEFGDPTALEVVVDALTAEASRIELGDRATITRWGGEDLDAHVRLIEPSAFTRLSSLGVEEQRVGVLLALDSPPEAWARLGDRWRVEARIQIDRVENARIVPQSAVFRRGQGWAVYEVVDDVARLTDVEVGLKNGLEVQILSGLDEGARVVVFPGDRVGDGVRVTARE